MSLGSVPRRRLPLRYMHRSATGRQRWRTLWRVRGSFGRGQDRPAPISGIVSAKASAGLLHPGQSRGVAVFRSATARISPSASRHMSIACGRTRRSRRSAFSTAPSGCGDPASYNRMRVPVPAWIWGQATTSEPRSRVMDRSAARAGGRPPSRSLQSPASTAPRQHREAAHGFHRRGDVGLARTSPEENEVALRMAAGGRRLRGGTGCRPHG